MTSVKLANGSDARKKIGLFSCLLFGLALLLPLAPVPVYGEIQPLSQGHMALCYMLAAIPMAFTAWSFGAMGAEFPRAGSSYTFVSKGIHPYLGFVVGWTILLDYGLFPLLNYVTFSIYFCELFPGVNYTAVIVIAIVAICIVNMLGIKSIAGINNILTIFGFLVVFYFFYASINALNDGVGMGMSTLGRYNPESFDVSNLITGASIACFSYLGFDAITTLAEDVKEPKKTLPKATILTCVIMTVLFIFMSWLAQNLHPSFDYNNPNAAFIDAAKVAGGVVMENLISLAMVACAFAFSLDMMAGITRLLFGMGRDGVLPKKIFGFANKKGVPVYNIIIITIICLIFSNATLGDLIPLINFGGLLAFTCVNLAVIFHFFGKRKLRSGSANIAKWLILPGIGFITCVLLWIGLPTKWLGAIWLAIGVVYLAVYTRGFRRKITAFDDEAAAGQNVTEKD
jgi:amino acid transporter